MAIIQHDFSVDITPGARPQIIYVSEYDIGRQFAVTIMSGDEVFTIPANTAATIEGTIADHGFTADATVASNKVYFSLTEDMTAVAGLAWTKIKLVNSNEPVSTCAFILAVDRAGVEADTVIGASGFEEQIQDAVDAWLDDNPPSGGGLTTEIKQALLDCLAHVAWIGDDGQDYYDALETALNSAQLVSISAVFTQGTAVILTTDSLSKLKQYLVVTANYEDGRTVEISSNNYSLSGELVKGTSTITATYGAFTTTFTVNVTLDTNVVIEYNDYILTYSSSKNTMVNTARNNGGITKKYDMPEASTSLYPAGIIPTNSTTVIAENGASLAVYDDQGNRVTHANEYNRWAQQYNGTMTEFSNQWSPVSTYSKIAFTVDVRYLDRAYMYDKDTGHVWFAGENTPYFGMENISEASA